MSRNKAGGENDQRLVAVDDGYAQIKVAWIDRVTGRMDTNIIPSWILRGAHLTRRMRDPFAVKKEDDGLLVGGVINGIYITGENDDVYTCGMGDSGDYINTQGQNFHYRDINRVLVNHALAASGFQGEEIHLIASMPVGDYFSDPATATLNEDAIRRKQQNLLTEVRKHRHSGYEPPKIQTAQVMPQAAMAILDWATDDEGRPIAERNSRAVVLVDIGGYNVDFSAARPARGGGGLAIEYDKSFTLHSSGILALHEELQNTIHRMGFRCKLSPEEAEDVLLTGRWTVGDEKYDMSEPLRDVMWAFAGRIFDAIESRMDGILTDHTARIVLVGGGAEVFRKHSEGMEFSHDLVVAEEPELCNVRGMLLYANMMEKEQG